jgi:hypothetical protein
MKSAVLLDKIIREELVKVREEQLTEFIAASKVNKNFKPEDQEPWNTPAEAALKELGAQPFDNGINPDGYEITFKMYGTGAGDRLWFYDNGDVISTNNAKIIGYHLNDKGVLELWSEPWSKEKLPDNTYWKIGDLKRVGNNVTLIETEENKRRRGVKPKAAEEHPLLDKIQFGLDIAGMFPIVGDILDVVNAGISLFRIYYFKEDTWQRWLDFFLSIIAVIPFVGSAAKASIKAALSAVDGAKFLKLFKRAGDSAEGAKELWAALKADGVFTEKTMKEFANGADEIVNKMKTSYKDIEKYPYGDELVGYLKKLEDFFQKQKFAINDLGGAVKRADDLTALKQMPDVVKNASFLKRFGNNITFQLVPKLKQLPWFPAKKLQAIAVGIEKRFVKQAADPGKLTVMMKFDTAGKRFLNQADGLFKSRLGKMDPAELQMLQRRIPGLKNASFDLAKLSTQKLAQFWKTIKRLDPKLYNAVANDIVTTSMKSGNNAMFTLFKNNELENLKTLMSKDMIPGVKGGKDWIKSFDVSFRKNADLIWNEIQDASESFGIKDKDELNGIVWPVITAGVASYMPGVYNAGLSSRDFLKKLKGTPEVQAASSIIAPDELTSYDVSKQGGGEYK